MTNSPADLLAVRAELMTLTGVTNPADMGIVGDGAHQHTGGYHEGRDVLTALGIAGTDYSVAEYARDRTGLSNSASAFDMALAWSTARGGRAAAIKATNLLVADLRNAHPGMVCVRAMNYTPDGTAKRRVDRRGGLVPGSSSDSVDIHTHFEFFRDTEGQRAGAFLTLVRQRILQAQGGTTMELAGVQASELYNGDAAAWGVYTNTDVAIISGNAAGGVPVLYPNGLRAKLAAMDAKLDALAGPAQVTMSQADREAIAALVIAGMPVPPTAQQNAVAVLNEQHARDAA